MKKLVLKTVCRTLFYQFFILFIGISIGFICNAEIIGCKTQLVSKSFKNIFFPVKFDKEVCSNLKSWGAFKLYAKNQFPPDFEIVEDALLAEEFYWLKYSFTNSNGEKEIAIDNIRLRWKTWEYYYGDGEVMTDEEITDYIENGTLNSKESDEAYRLMFEYQQMLSKRRSDVSE